MGRVRHLSFDRLRMNGVIGRCDGRDVIGLVDAVFGYEACGFDAVAVFDVVVGPVQCFDEEGRYGCAVEKGESGGGYGDVAHIQTD